MNPNKKSLPKIGKQASTLATAILKAGDALIKKEMVFVSKELLQERQTICDTCEFYIAERRRCSKCGCRTAYKLKMATEACPEGKWLAAAG